MFLDGAVKFLHQQAIDIDLDYQCIEVYIYIYSIYTLIHYIIMISTGC